MDVEGGVTQASSKGASSRFKWTKIMDKALVECLQEISVSTYWKLENGFRSGYLGQLEKMMKAKFEHLSISAKPHIESRVKTLKRQTMAINDLLINGSGFSWNDVDCTIGIDDEQWKEWLKIHPSAKGIKNKSFPHYDALLEVFSGSRATGEGMATGFDEGAEVLAEDEAEGCNESDFPNDDHLDYLDGISMTQPGGEYNQFASSPDPTPTPSPGPSTSSTQKVNNNKKVKTNEYVQGLGEVAAGLKEFIASSERQTEIIAEAMLKSASYNPKTIVASTIVTELSKIPNLNVDDMMMAGMKLLADESLQAMFLAIPEDMRSHFVNKVLAKDV